MNSTGNIGVVVVSFQSESSIRLCLERLLAAHGVWDIVVIDNHSSDQTRAIVSDIARDATRIRLVSNSDNRGFAAACNQGASALATPWVAFVNPDVFVEIDSLAILTQHASQRPGAGLIGAELVDEKGVADLASRRSDPSLQDLLAQIGKRDNLYLGRDSRQNVQSVEAISGALMLLPLGLFLKLGGFDEGYRLHVEDLDLCRRIRLAGYEVLIANDVVVVHRRGVSSRSRPIWVEWQKHRSLWRYFMKFEASLTPQWQKPVLWCGVWLHFFLAMMRTTWRRFYE